VLAAAHMLDLFPNELTCLSGRPFTFGGCLFGFA
jgi:hypothetical protein